MAKMIPFDPAKNMEAVGDAIRNGRCRTSHIPQTMAEVTWPITPDDRERWKLEGRKLGIHVLTPGDGVQKIAELDLSGPPVASGDTIEIEAITIAIE